LTAAGIAINGRRDLPDGGINRSKRLKSALTDACEENAIGRRRSARDAAMPYPKQRKYLFLQELENETVVGVQRSALAILVMCHSCVEIDKKIEHYRRLQRSITDQLTIETINKLIYGLSAQKDSLHPDQNGSPGVERR
jgi:hypothetical protein